MCTEVWGRREPGKPAVARLSITPGGCEHEERTGPQGFPVCLASALASSSAPHTSTLDWTSPWLLTHALWHGAPQLAALIPPQVILLLLTRPGDSTENHRLKHGLAGTQGVCIVFC